MRRVKSEFGHVDKDHDGFVTLREYLEDDFDKDVRGTGDEDSVAGYNRVWVRRARRLWNLTDVDQDGRLNETEYYLFVHPEESGRHGHLSKTLTELDVNDHDSNDDRVLNFTEFYQGVFTLVDDASIIEPKSSSAADDGGVPAMGQYAWNDDKRRARATALFASIGAAARPRPFIASITSPPVD